MCPLPHPGGRSQPLPVTTGRARPLWPGACAVDEGAGRDDPVGRKPLGRKERRRKAFLIMQDVNLQLFGDSVLAEARLGGTATEQEALAALERMNLARYAQATPPGPFRRQKQRLASWMAAQRERTADFRRTHQRAGPRHMLEVSRPAPGAGGAGAVRAGHHSRRGVPAGERRPSRFLAVGGMTS